MIKKYHYSPSINEIVNESFTDMRQKSYVSEGFKGCLGIISKTQVSLEPAFRSYRCMDFGKTSQMNKDDSLYVPDESNINLTHIRVWFAKEDDDFNSREAFKSLLTRLGALGQKFKIVLGGNKERVLLIIGVDESLVTPTKNAITSIYPRSEIDINNINPLFENLKKDNDLGYREYFSPHPYWRSLSIPDQRFSLSMLPCLCSEVDRGELGFYELTIQPCNNDWGGNVFNLCGAERDGGVPLHVSKDWREAGFGCDYSDLAKQKINLPMYAVSIRIGAYCKEDKVDSILKTLSLPVASLLFGGQRLKYVTEQDYIEAIGEEKTLDMILNSKSYRAGSLYSLDELSALSPFFERSDLVNPKYSLDLASGILIPEEVCDGDGAYIGNVFIAGKSRQKCFVKENFRKQGISIRSVMGGGKSNLQAQIFGYDLERKRNLLESKPEVNMSIVMIELCKDLYSLCLHKLKKGDSKYVKVFDPTIKGYVPKYNIVSLREGEDIDRKADNRTSHLENMFPANEWSGGIGFMIRNSFYLLLADPDAVLSDIRLILEDSDEGKEARAKALLHLDNEEVRKFWEKDFYGIDKRKKNLALRKVTALLSDKRVQAMFSVKENCFDAFDILNNGECLLGNISEGEIGTSAAKLIAGSIAGDVADAGRGRVTLSPSQRELSPCHFTIDEFYKIFSKEFENFTVSMRKYNVCLNFSYHFDEQLSKELQAGIKNFGTHIALKQSFNQAKSHAYPQFLGKVSDPNDFVNLKPGWGYIITPDSQVKKFKSDLQTEDGDQEAIDEVIKKNLEENYVKISDLKKEAEEKGAHKMSKKRMGEEI